MSGGVASTAQACDRVVRLSELLPSQGDLIILHNDRRYRLRLTKQARLLLTRDEGVGGAGLEQDSVEGDRHVR